MTDADKKILKEWLDEGEEINPFEWQPLDFTDWRIIGQVINKVHKDHWHEFELRHYIMCALWCSNPQEAICAAVVAYLKESKP